MLVAFVVVVLAMGSCNAEGLEGWPWYSPCNHISDCKSCTAMPAGTWTRTVFGKTFATIDYKGCWWDSTAAGHKRCRMWTDQTSYPLGIFPSNNDASFQLNDCCQKIPKAVMFTPFDCLFYSTCGGAAQLYCATNQCALLWEAWQLWQSEFSWNDAHYICDSFVDRVKTEVEGSPRAQALAELLQVWYDATKDACTKAKTGGQFNLEVSRGVQGVRTMKGVYPPKATGAATLALMKMIESFLKDVQKWLGTQNPPYCEVPGLVVVAKGALLDVVSTSTSSPPSEHDGAIALSKHNQHNVLQP